MSDTVPGTNIPKLKFRKVSKIEMEARNKRFSESFRRQEDEEERREAERWKPKKETIGTCRCKGKIVLVTTYTSNYNPMSGPIIIGPGSRGQFSRVEHQECFCENCASLYKAEVVKKKRG